MAKKDKQNNIDKDLQDLYARAKKEKLTVVCPHCNKEHTVDMGGDFQQLKVAMELRLKYEAIKLKKDTDEETPSFFSQGEPNA